MVKTAGSVRLRLLDELFQELELRNGSDVENLLAYLRRDESSEPSEQRLHNTVRIANICNVLLHAGSDADCVMFMNE